MQFQKLNVLNQFSSVFYIQINIKMVYFIQIMAIRVKLLLIFIKSGYDGFLNSFIQIQQQQNNKRTFVIIIISVIINNMIKLNINIGSTNTKVLVDYIYEQQPTVISFLKRVVNICALTDVTAQDLQLLDQDFILPHKLPSRYISEDKIYTVALAHSQKRKIIQNKKKQKVAAANNKKQKISKPKPKQSSSSFSENQSESESQSQSIAQSQSSESHSSLKKKPLERKIIKQKQSIQNAFKKVTPKANKNARPKLQLKQKISSSNSSQSQQIVAYKKPKQKPISKNKQQSSSQSSLEESSTPLPQIGGKNLKLKNQIQSKPTIQKPNNNTKKNNQKAEGNANIIKNKLVISDSSSSESQNKMKQYTTKVKQILQNVKNAQPKIALTIKQPSQSTIQTNIKNQNNSSIINKPRIIPHSVKAKTNINQNKTTTNKQQANQIASQNKPQQSHQPNLSFKQHQQMKWIAITKELIKDWTIAHPQMTVIQQKNEIRFKIIQLDEVKFIPVSSGWVLGFVSSVQKKGTSLIIVLENTTKHATDDTGKSEFFKTYQVPMHNMQQLQINKNTLSEQQKTIIKNKQQNIQQNPKQSQIAVQQVTEKKPTNIAAQDKQKPVQSLQEFVCGQIHYYFGDKNYPTDLFMHMHANKDADKFIQAKLMLNFGKIKKVLNDQNKLWHFLTTDDKYPSRSYQLDFQRRMIKKKGL